jgi:hypothetical protein
MLDFSSIVLNPLQGIFGRPVVITPYESQPGVQPYSARGVYVTTPVDIQTEAGVVFSDQRTMLRIRLAEYARPPVARDYVYVPAHMSSPEAGPFEILDVDEFADGMAQLTLRMAIVDEPRPVA